MTTKQLMLRAIDSTNFVLRELATYHGTDKLNKAIKVEGLDVQEIKEKWANEISRLTDDQIKRGLLITKKGDYAPTLASFIDACSPNPKEAFSEAQLGMKSRSEGKMGYWSIRAVYWTATRFNVKDAVWKNDGERWSIIYNEYLKRESSLQPIPSPVSMSNRLGHSEVKESDESRLERKQRALPHLEKIKNILNRKNK